MNRTAKLTLLSGIVLCFLAGVTPTIFDFLFHPEPSFAWTIAPLSGVCFDLVGLQIVGLFVLRSEERKERSK